MSRPCRIHFAGIGASGLPSSVKLCHASPIDPLAAIDAAR